MDVHAAAPLGFIGLGSMGEPMARNLLRAGIRVMVWNRTPEKCAALAADGALVADSASDVFAQCRTIILMLTGGDAIDAVLQRESAGFAAHVRDRTIVNMATASPAYSRELDAAIRAAGGAYVEAPLSGSRIPAESGTLVAMLAGDAASVGAVRRLLQPMCRRIAECGAVPNALLMKLAVNQYMIALTAGLAEAVHFARAYRLDLAQFAAILDAGPMASDYAHIKAAKLRDGDFSVQATVSNARESTRLICAAARAARIASPLIDVCDALLLETEALGRAGTDIAGVIRAVEARTAGYTGRSTGAS